MSELRQDPTTREWVVIAVERAKRPDQFHRQVDHRDSNAEDRSACPFCLGNEPLTPEEVFALPLSGRKDRTGWRVRVVPNKFAALAPEESILRHDHGRFFHSLDGFGYHEVVIESPEHTRQLPLMNEGEILDILDTYCKRYTSLRKDSRIKLILVFRNHGQRAGTSLRHPHSQLVAMPIIPLYIRRKYEVAIQHSDETGRCLYCDVVAEEKAVAKRVVLETSHLLVFIPLLLRFPSKPGLFPGGTIRVLLASIRKKRGS